MVAIWGPLSWAKFSESLIRRFGEKVNEVTETEVEEDIGQIKPSGDSEELSVIEEQGDISEKRGELTGLDVLTVKEVSDWDNGLGDSPKQQEIALVAATSIKGVQLGGYQAEGFREYQLYWLH
ncbi:OLC1v1030790C1 [Oldenlandia corymbosa var. corymbosa]|uniref:OLC1v1030790C1 n=1 Tax=Oldenlandia corymbosa var. corymbosa TaxID=529605 RepID=A0AAV1CKE9_OLDCO|nr:OLC1v1030790C1 [Oldenlandia corymbosa var. corymbosa]